MQEIKLTSTQELLKELFSRFNHAIFAARKDNVKGKDDDRGWYNYSGDPQTCRGLCNTIDDIIGSDLQSESEDIEPE